MVIWINSGMDKLVNELLDGTRDCGHIGRLKVICDMLTRKMITDYYVVMYREI